MVGKEKEREDKKDKISLYFLMIRFRSKALQFSKFISKDRYTQSTD